MPLIAQTYENWSSKGLVLYAVDISESQGTVTEFLAGRGVSFPVLFDSASNMADAYRVSSIPTTLFIDSNGVIRQKIVGAFPSRQAIEYQLKKIMP